MIGFDTLPVESTVTPMGVLITMLSFMACLLVGILLIYLEKRGR